MERILCIVAVVTVFLTLSSASMVRRQGHDSNARPAFSVGLTHNMTFSTPGTVLYDRVFLDTTSSYNPVTGMYTVPLTGDYVVMIHALAELNGMLRMEVDRNDQHFFSIYAHTTDQYAGASNIAVVRYNKGDTMKVTGEGTSILYGLTDEIYSTLSAYLLYEHHGNN